MGASLIINTAESIRGIRGKTRDNLANPGNQANLVESSNKTLKTMIAAFVGADHRNWDAHIHELRHAINTATQSSVTGFLKFPQAPASREKSAQRSRGSASYFKNVTVGLDR